MGLTLALYLMVSPTSAQNLPPYVSDPEFPAAFDMYWRANLLSRYAGNHVCALPNNVYDDPKSPYRPIDERLKRARLRFDKRFPTALTRAAPPYRMPPPQSGKCDDAGTAWQMIFGFETAVVGLENLLDRIDPK